MAGDNAVQSIRLRKNVSAHFACGLFSILVLLSDNVSMRGFLRRVASEKDSFLTVDGKIVGVINEQVQF